MNDVSYVRHVTYVIQVMRDGSWHDSEYLYQINYEDTDVARAAALHRLTMARTDRPSERFRAIVRIMEEFPISDD